jgi:hypothetical protein
MRFVNIDGEGKCDDPELEYLVDPPSCNFLAKTVCNSTAMTFTILLVDGVKCGRSHWPVSMC